jgi:hypothetical protein
MTTRRSPAWAELIQLIPIISLALPFMLAGKVDLARAGVGFLLGAFLTLPISAAVVVRRHLLNPILVGTGLWLWLGLVAFYLPFPALRGWLVGTQAFGLFVGALLVGLGAMALSPWGYIAYRSDDPRWNRKASLALLALTLLVVGWAWLFRHDIRMGGGLPFIVLNVTRRVIGRRAPIADPTPPSPNAATP